MKQRKIFNFKSRKEDETGCREKENREAYEEKKDRKKGKRSRVGNEREEERRGRQERLYRE